MSRKLAERWFDAFHDEDISILEGVLAEEFVHTSPFGEIKGKRVYLDMVRENADAFFSPTIKIIDVIEDGHKSAVRYLVNGNPACDCIYTGNGQISKIHSYYHVGEKPVL